MLRPKEMTKVAVVGGKADQAAIIDSLHKSRAVHIEQHAPGDLDIGTPLDVAEDVSEALVKANAVLGYWDIDAGDKNGLTERVSKTIRNLNKIHADLQKEDDGLRTTQERIQKLRSELQTAKALKSLGIKPEYTELRSVSVMAGTVKQPKKLEETVRAVTSDAEIAVKTEDGQSIAAIAVPSEKAEDVERILGTLGFQEFPTLTSGNVSSLKKDLKEAIAERKKHERAIADLKDKHGEYVKRSTVRLQEEAEKAEAPLSFAQSENLFYLTGFIPTTDLIVVTQQLERAAKKRVHIEMLPTDETDNVPIKLDHPKPVKSFEFFMDLYDLPRYSEFDPTFFTFLTFPLLFGFMLGDVGYGITTLLIWLTLKRFFPAARGFFNILITAALWSTFWGLMFGEVFGAEILFGYDLPRILSRLHEINSLLLLSLAVGVVHINMGLAIGFFNERRAHGLKAAIFEKGSWVVLQIAAALFYFSYGVPVFQVWVPYVVLAIALVMLYIGEGIHGIIEFPAIFSNILSYARLMAIGLASAGLAVVVNQFTSDFVAMGMAGFIPAILVFAFGHLINIGLGTLGPFLHSLRLHYVEFFSRFFKGGGRRFTPFGAKD